ncbi:transglutaminase domain-containing protein [Geminocystis sp. GBBB08]|uniref:transglutaminase domain-containing protein n=1 Tax=Geminocystis sp. GBBB08 TaxID=2604140 RepID=UPI0027E2C255|nr:transglutaminase domain-containing protein [Geminocystis sp. GBBB08]
MATNREYQEWERRINKARKNHQQKSSFISNLLIIIIFLSFGLTIKNYPQFFGLNSELLTWKNIANFLSFSPNSLKFITEEFVTKIDEPIVINNPVNLQEKRFTSIDNTARNIQYNGNSVQELANILSQYADTEEEKARIIYTWITDNITYDVAALADLFENNIYPDIKVETVLNTRSTICSGYANLYQQLAQYMGLKSVIVTGYAKGINYVVGDDNEVNHAWNAVKINQNWYIIDTTW